MVIILTRLFDLKNFKSLCRNNKRVKLMVPFPDGRLSCSCVGFDINSTMMEPFISEYNITSFVYDMS